MAMRETKRELLLHFWLRCAVSEGEEFNFQKWWIFSEKVCNFSLGLRPIGPSDFFGPRSKVVLRIEDYMWAPVSRVFDKIREVGVLSYLSYTLFKYFVDD